MSTNKTMWRKLAKDKRYRGEFALSFLKRMIPYQTRAIRTKRGWSQAQLAKESGLTQGVISRAEDPDYGNLTLTTIGRIAAGCDLAAIVKFVPFSELVKFSSGMSERDFANLPTFDQETEMGFPARFESLELSGLPKESAQREEQAHGELKQAAMAANVTDIGTYIKTGRKSDSNIFKAAESGEKNEIGFRRTG